MGDIIDGLLSIVGKDGMLRGSDAEPHCRDWRGIHRGCWPARHVLPAAPRSRKPVVTTKPPEAAALAGGKRDDLEYLRRAGHAG